jgi:hypothetical protein
MGGQMVNDPLFVPEILKHVGPVAFVDWFVHFVGLGSYTALNALGDRKPILLFQMLHALGVCDEACSNML